MSGPIAFWPHAWFHMESIVWLALSAGIFLAGRTKLPKRKTNCFLKTLNHMTLKVSSHTRLQEKLRLQGLGAEDVMKYKLNTLNDHQQSNLAGNSWLVWCDQCWCWFKMFLSMGPVEFIFRMPTMSSVRFTSSVCAAAVLSVLSCWHPSKRTRNSVWTTTSTWL